MTFLLSRGKTNGLLKFQFLVSGFWSYSDRQEEQNNRFVQCLYGKKFTGTRLINHNSLVQWATELGPRFLISVLTLSQTGPTQTSTAPPVVYHWTNQLMFDVYWSQSWTSAEKIGTEAMSCVGHFVFTLGQWSAILPYQIPWLGLVLFYSQ